MCTYYASNSIKSYVRVQKLITRRIVFQFDFVEKLTVYSACYYSTKIKFFCVDFLNIIYKYFPFVVFIVVGRIRTQFKTLCQVIHILTSCPSMDMDNFKTTLFSRTFFSCNGERMKGLKEEQLTTATSICYGPGYMSSVKS